VEEDGKMSLKTSRQKWDLTTGKQIKLNRGESLESSSSVDTDLSQFLNDLNSPTTDNFNMSCDHVACSQMKTMFLPARVVSAL